MTKQKMHRESQNKTYNISFQPSERRTRWRCWQLSWRSMLFALLCSLGASSSHGAATSAKMLKVFTKEIEGITHFYVQESGDGRRNCNF